MLVAIAGILTGIWLIIQSQQPVNSTITLSFGIVVAALCAVELIWGARPYIRQP